MATLSAPGRRQVALHEHQGRLQGGATECPGEPPDQPVLSEAEDEGWYEAYCPAVPGPVLSRHQLLPDPAGDRRGTSLRGDLRRHPGDESDR